MRRAVGLLLLIAATGLAAEPAADPATGPALTETQRTRYQDLIEELRCLVCQNRNIAESDAPLARDLRELVERRIAAGHSEAEIKAYLVERYGEFVLYRPPFKPATWMLWLGPLGLLMLAAGVALWLWRRVSSRTEPVPPDRTEIERLLRNGDS